MQFADFDYKDVSDILNRTRNHEILTRLYLQSPVVADTGSPDYGFAFEQVYTVDEVICLKIDLFAKLLLNEYPDSC